MLRFSTSPSWSSVVHNTSTPLRNQQLQNRRLGCEEVPLVIRFGLVGPAAQLDRVRTWLERCLEPIAAVTGAEIAGFQTAVYERTLDEPGMG